MKDPVYAVHDRIAARRRAIPEGTWQRQTADMYGQLVEHILHVYPDSGPLRSMALRKLSESLNDLLDHEILVRNQRPHGTHQQASPSGA